MGGPDLAFYRRARQAGQLEAPSAPIPAAAALLWRRRGGEGDVEIYLAERSPSRSFLGGFWSFPGGAVEEGDRAAPLSAGTDHEAEKEGAARAACARELREETGVDAAAGAAEFVPAGRWLTPEFSPIRYDTRYYAVPCPPGAEPDTSVSGGELSAGRWLAPEEALSAWRRGEMLIAPPALAVLELLRGGFRGLPERAEEAARAAESGPPVWEVAPAIASIPLRTPTLPPATHTNCYLLGEREIVVVDPGSPYPEEQEILERVVDARVAAGARLRAVALTHHHPDHTGGVAALRERYGVPLWAHPETAALAGGADRELSPGERIELGGDPPAVFEVIHTPGHAPGHVCFADERTRYAVAGDMVAGVGTIVIDPDEGDMQAYLDSLMRLRRADLGALLPAHGPPLTRPAQSLDAYLAHRRWREEKLLAALGADPAPVSALRAAVYDDAPAAAGPLAERSLRSHLEKLAREGRARSTDEGWRRA